MVFITHFMVHTNNGRPKFWALADDGSSIFGSMVNMGIKTSRNGGSPDEKRRKGYVEVPISSPCPCNVIVELAALSTGSMVPRMRDISLKLYVDSMALTLLSHSVLAINLSSTLLPTLNRRGFFTGTVPPQPEALEATAKTVVVEIFNKDFDPSKQEFSF